MIIEINEEISSLLLLDFGILSTENSRKLRILLDRQEKFWAHEVTTQRLKSRMLWIKDGDANKTKFHSYALAHRNTNTIWSLLDEEGNLVAEDSTLKRLGEHHFWGLFKDDDSTNLEDQLKVINLFLTLTMEEDVDRFLDLITSQEVEAVLKGFKKDKSPGPDGWPVEFFLTFFGSCWGKTGVGC